MLVMAVMLWLVAWWALFYTGYRFFFRQPSVLIKAEAVRLCKGMTVEKTLWGRDITSFSVVEIMVSIEDSSPAKNYILVAQTSDGAKEGLCITDKRQQVDSIIASLRNRGYSINA
jgi:hypothetical protein